MTTLSSDSLSSLTKALSGAVDLIEMLRERELNEASGFSPFAEELVYMGETGVCRILKILLSPKASHGQGARLLEAILALVPEAGFDASNERFIKVGVERQLWELGSNRRVDIVVDCPRFILAFEVKLWAEDQPRQVADYLRWLKRVAGGRRYFLIYLTPDGHNPSPESLPAEEAELYRGHCAPLAWLAVMEELRKSASATPERVKIFINDFLASLEEHLWGKGRIVMKEEITKYIAERGEPELSAARMIRDNYEDAVNLIINRWINRLTEELRRRGVLGEIRAFSWPNKSGEETYFIHIDYPRKKLVVGVYAADYYGKTLDWGLFAKCWEFLDGEKRVDMKKCMEYPPIQAAMKIFKAENIYDNNIVRNSCGPMPYTEPEILALMNNPDRAYLADELFDICREVETIPDGEGMEAGNGE